jgi:hypothetical protein
MSHLSSACEASVLVRRVAEPRVVGDSVKAAIRRAARRLGWRFSRTRDVWYGRARRIDAEELDTLRRATAEARDTLIYLVALRDALAVTDPAFHGQSLLALDWAIGRLGGNPRSQRVRGREETTDTD